MHRIRPAFSFSGLTGKIVAGVALASVLLLTVLAASPVAHAWFHDHGSDAGSGSSIPHGDHCAIAQFSQGIVPTATDTVIGQPVCLLVAPTQTDAAVIARAPLLRLPPPCGPPLV
jgi:hypothetical protein